nr:carboxymuconolactone decarboxylase family protein [uncultured Marinifilum sp.]
MKTEDLKARIFTTKEFYKHVKIAVNNFSDIQRIRKTSSVSKAFSEKVMLAVTKVNGCRLCNYVHTKNAIDAGASEEEINTMVNGELGNVENNESIALLFAQHYADTNGNYDLETYHKFEEHYGEKKAHDILTAIRIIMAANIHGISLDALQSRFKGKKMKGSKFRNELGISFGIIFMIPTAFLQIWFKNLTSNKPKQNAE